MDSILAQGYSWACYFTDSIQVFSIVWETIFLHRYSWSCYFTDTIQVMQHCMDTIMAHEYSWAYYISQILYNFSSVVWTPYWHIDILSLVILQNLYKLCINVWTPIRLYTSLQHCMGDHIGTWIFQLLLFLTDSIQVVYYCMDSILAQGYSYAFYFSQTLHKFVALYGQHIGTRIFLGLLFYRFYSSCVAIYGHHIGTRIFLVFLFLTDSIQVVYYCMDTNQTLNKFVAQYGTIMAHKYSWSCYFSLTLYKLCITVWTPIRLYTSLQHCMGDHIGTWILFVLLFLTDFIQVVY